MYLFTYICNHVSVKDPVHIIFETVFIHRYYLWFFYVLSETVANALEHTKGNEVEETVKFVRMVDKFFDCLNVNSFTQGKHKRKPFQDSYRYKDDFRIKVHMYFQWLKEEFLQYLQDWENSVEQCKGYTPKAK